MKFHKNFIFFCLLVFLGCINTRRIRNYNWELDSLRYYTIKIDSMLRVQEREIEKIKVDYWTRTGEISEKIDMLTQRLKEQEDYLSRNWTAHKQVGKEYTPTIDEKTIYDAAYTNYIKGNYNEAINGFRNFSKIYENSPIVDNALYWIGESFIALGKRQDAVDTFNELIQRYPHSSKVPTALYKIGVIYESADDKEKAQIYFEKVILEFPDSPEATLSKNRLGKE